MTSASDRVLRWAPYGLLAVTLLWVTENAWGPLKDPDAWWHLRLGEDFLHQGSLAAPAQWSSFATASWVPTEPLPEVAVALVRRGLGLPGVVWLYVATIIVVVLATFSVCRRYAAPLPAAVATMLFVAAGEGSLTPRPQLISYVLLLVVLEAWARTEIDLKPRWWLVPLCWLWSLCHGFWFVGVGYGALGVLAVALSRRADLSRLLRLAAVAVASFAGVLLNPLGPAVIEGPFQVSQFTQYVTEWARPSLTSGPALTATTMALATVAVWLMNRRSFTYFRALLLLSALVWDWYAMRTMVLGALVAAPVLAAALQTLIPAAADAPHPGVGRRERSSLVAAGTVLLALAALVVPHSADRPGDVPVALDPQLDRLPPGTPVFNDYLLGGWIAWRHPDLNQYIDGLITPYTAAHVRGYYRTQVLSRGWYAVVLDSRAPVALLDSRSTLAAALERRGWTPAGTDAGYVLLLNASAPHAPDGSGGTSG